MICPTCGAQNPQDARFCGSCGTALTPTMPNAVETPTASAQDTPATMNLPEAQTSQPAAPASASTQPQINGEPPAAQPGRTAAPANASPPHASAPSAADIKQKAQTFLQPAVKQLKALPVQKILNKKVLAAVLAAVLVLTGTLVAVLYQSDEDKIFSRLDAFATALNEGDAEMLLECMTPAARSELEAVASLGSAAADYGLGIDGGTGLIWGLWSLGIQDMAQGTDYILEVYDLSFPGENSAEATIVLVYGTSNRDEGVFELVKQDGDWYLSDARGI